MSSQNINLGNFAIPGSSDWPNEIHIGLFQEWCMALATERLGLHGFGTGPEADSWRLGQQGAEVIRFLPSGANSLTWQVEASSSLDSATIRDMLNDAMNRTVAEEFGDQDLVCTKRSSAQPYQTSHSDNLPPTFCAP